jgi:hypothetical protein
MKLPLLSSFGIVSCVQLRCTSYCIPTHEAIGSWKVFGLLGLLGDIREHATPILCKEYLYLFF